MSLHLHGDSGSQQADMQILTAKTQAKSGTCLPKTDSISLKKEVHTLS
jgi:hypothetical protein